MNVAIVEDDPTVFQLQKALQGNAPLSRLVEHWLFDRQVATPIRPDGVPIQDVLERISTAAGPTVLFADLDLRITRRTVEKHWKRLLVENRLTHSDGIAQEFSGLRPATQAGAMVCAAAIFNRNLRPLRLCIASGSNSQHVRTFISVIYNTLAADAHARVATVVVIDDHDLKIFGAGATPQQRSAHCERVAVFIKRHADELTGSKDYWKANRERLLAIIGKNPHATADRDDVLQKLGIVLGESLDALWAFNDTKDGGGRGLLGQLCFYPKGENAILKVRGLLAMLLLAFRGSLPRETEWRKQWSIDAWKSADLDSAVFCCGSAAPNNAIAFSESLYDWAIAAFHREGAWGASVLKNVRLQEGRVEIVCDYGAAKPESMRASFNSPYSQSDNFPNFRRLCEVSTSSVAELRNPQPEAKTATLKFEARGPGEAVFIIDWRL